MEEHKDTEIPRIQERILNIFTAAIGTAALAGWSWCMLTFWVLFNNRDSFFCESSGYACEIVMLWTGIGAHLPVFAFIALVLYEEVYVKRFRKKV